MKHHREADQKALDETHRYAKTILNSLSAHIAIIDKNGIILETNRAWKRFALTNNIRMRPDTLYVNYLDICESAHGESADSSLAVASGIRKVITGDLDKFDIDYACHSPHKKRWFYMRATRAAGSKPLKVVISHENITDLKIAEQRLKESEEALKLKTTHLEEANAALRAILRQREVDKEELEQIFFQNLRETVLPYFERLKQMDQKTESRQLLSLIESGLNDIASPFRRRLSNLEALLTPQEIHIAALIREGKSTKDIANLLNLSTTTINFHRRNLRDKLKLRNTSVNLRSHLLSLEK